MPDPAFDVDLSNYPTGACLGALFGPTVSFAGGISLATQECELLQCSTSASRDMVNPTSDPSQQLAIFASRRLAAWGSSRLSQPRRPRLQRMRGEVACLFCTRIAWR